MALVIQEEQRQHLDSLDLQPAAINKLLSTALRSKFQFSEEAQTFAANALLKILFDAKKLNLSNLELISQLQATCLSEEQIKAVADFYDKDLDLLTTPHDFSFRDLEWRIEAKVSSRFLAALSPDPKVLMEIHLDREKSLQHRQILKELDSEVSSKKKLLISSDVNSLIHIIDSLENVKNTISLRKIRAPVKPN